jgi:hypothetical protein
MMVPVTPTGGVARAAVGVRSTMPMPIAAAAVMANFRVERIAVASFRKSA